MLPNDAHYNPNYILMLKSNASIHHWNEIQMLTIDKLNNNKKVHRTRNCLCIFIRKDEAMVVAVQEYLSGQKNHENKTKILTEKEEKKKVTGSQ